MRAGSTGRSGAGTARTRPVQCASSPSGFSRVTARTGASIRAAASATCSGPSRFPMSTAIVSGALANNPGNGGNAWTRLSVVRGLRRLGFDTFFVEQLDQPSAEAVAYFESVVNDFGLADRSALLVGGKAIGVGLEELTAAADDAALLVNIAGHL